MFYYNLRVAHREPAHPDAHVHVLPALQVPPFEQTGVQTAKKTKDKNNRTPFSSYVLDVWE